MISVCSEKGAILYRVKSFFMNFNSSVYIKMKNIIPFKPDFFFFNKLKSCIKHRFSQNNKFKKPVEVNVKPGHPGKVFKCKTVGSTHLY